MLTDIISRVRRNHGLEHATINLLSQKYPHQRFAGHSDWQGFWIVGDIPTAELLETAEKALEALRSGRRNLALHSNCGTNLVTSGMLSGLAGALGMMGAGKKARDKVERIPLVTTLSILALLISRPLGMLAQKHLTTSGDPQSLEIIQVAPSSHGDLPTHRVLTQG
jgi:hypothetical protein